MSVLIRVFPTEGQFADYRVKPLETFAGVGAVGRAFDYAKRYIANLVAVARTTPAPGYRMVGVHVVVDDQSGSNLAVLRRVTVHSDGDDVQVYQD